ncbi:hypothetical protein [Stenotrophomonas maltophilia]|uniref:hypothetical protein n=1 Tax=Stenotrophomonas maltophilia TaxID=40324 RepID=UPI0013DD04C4|nr:hypothetical protein [Stenotrophomonas maltophilia]
MNFTEAITIGTVVFAGVSAIGSAITAVITASSIRGTRRDQESKQMLEQAVLSLERAYEALAKDAKPYNPPEPDRIAWLSAARLLTQYQWIKKRVTSVPHKLVLEEQEEHWRHRFYLLLQPLIGVRGVGYYSGGPSLAEKEELIEPMSAVVIHTFAKWPEGKVDPLAALQPDSIDPNAEFLKGNMGLQRYLGGRGFIRSTGPE